MFSSRPSQQRMYPRLPPALYLRLPLSQSLSLSLLLFSLIFVSIIHRSIYNRIAVSTATLPPGTVNMTVIPRGGFHGTLPVCFFYPGYAQYELHDVSWSDVCNVNMIQSFHDPTLPPNGLVQTPLLIGMSWQVPTSAIQSNGTVELPPASNFKRVASSAPQIASQASLEQTAMVCAFPCLQLFSLTSTSTFSKPPHQKPFSPQ
jgi:hypothetical protein